MFDAYPGFEGLTLRVEVEWQGRARPVVVQIVQWPAFDSEAAVVLCVMEDDAEAGERIVTDYNALYFVPLPQSLIHRRNKISLTRPYLNHTTH